MPARSTGTLDVAAAPRWAGLLTNTAAVSIGMFQPGKPSLPPNVRSVGIVVHAVNVMSGSEAGVVSASPITKNEMAFADDGLTSLCLRCATIRTNV